MCSARAAGRGAGPSPSRAGRYSLRESGDMMARISYDDFAIALLDEIEAPRQHRSHPAVT
ncbi:hypothetical protein GCM10010277_69690 [Streptomyces longisporoflavus]|nr:hypothetical protein GCM10010277_69690 [Streptomyces longisporoflavus]